MNRLIKRKNLFALLFAVLLALPMCAILGRVLYTQWNKNAKDSYSDSYIQSLTLVNNSTLMIEGGEYLLEYKQYGTNHEYSNVAYYSSLSFDPITYGAPSQYTYVGFRTAYNMLQFYAQGVTSSVWIFYNWSSVLDSITFTLSNGTLWNGNNTGDNNTYLITKKINSLDNAFEYSVNQFIEDNNFGKLDFFQWFDNMFLDSNNSVNNMYVHFVNWYLNYALLISLAYILFLVLMWFINYVRKLLEKGMDFGEGSY